MPFQNRVDPFGAIHAVSARGMFTGNRGVIHDPATRTLLKSGWSTKAWIICDCTFHGRKREVFGRNAPSGGPGWTNLFFLDEATGLAAGHRPCFFCRREKAMEFLDCFGKAFGISKPKVSEIDELLHRERLASGGTPCAIPPEEITALPDGAMIAVGTCAFAIRTGSPRRWTFEGYEGVAYAPAIEQGPIHVLTPSTTLAALAAGYRPAWLSPTRSDGEAGSIATGR